MFGDSWRRLAHDRAGFPAAVDYDRVVIDGTIQPGTWRFRVDDRVLMVRLWSPRPMGESFVGGSTRIMGFIN